LESRPDYAKPKTPEEPPERPTRFMGSVGLLVAVVTIGSMVMYGLGHGRWSLFESIYMVVNAVSTSGFREIDGMEDVQFSRGVTIIIILFGLVTVAYFQSNLTAILVQGIIVQRFRYRRMEKRINTLTGHVVVAGAGSTGVHVIEELYATKTPFVVIDRSRDVLERISRELTDNNLLYVVGEATDDSTLMAAGITRASGVVAALTEDKDNLYVTLSARSLNATARIVSKVIAPDAAPKMMRAGANATVSPNMLGGRRLASEIVRPTAVEFIDQMLHDKEDVLRLEEVIVPDGSWFVGRTLREVPIRAETNLLVVAIRVDRKFLYNPEPSTQLEVGSQLVVLGAAKNVARLREIMRQQRVEGNERP
jgi:voltage-gated potassium channel